jgi:hypothetical protein
MGLESLRAMLDTLEGLQAEQVVIKENIGKLKMHIQLEMEAQDATLFEDDAWKVEIKPKFDYRDESLIALREFYSPEELEALMNKPRPRTFHKGKIKPSTRARSRRNSARVETSSGLSKGQWRNFLQN